jgi:hypothetical protein
MRHHKSTEISIQWPLLQYCSSADVYSTRVICLHICCFLTPQRVLAQQYERAKSIIKANRHLIRYACTSRNTATSIDSGSVVYVSHC